MPTSPLEFGLLAALILAFAALYSSGGHAGASAYLAAIALFGIAPEVMKPTALVMNIVVAIVGTVRFTAAQAVPWKLLQWLYPARHREPLGGNAADRRRSGGPHPR